MTKEGSPIITSVHIEKTGGTSGVKIFEDVVGREHLAFYDPVADSLTRSSRMVVPQSSKVLDKLQIRYSPIMPMIKGLDHWLRSFRQGELEVPKGIKAIHGHFRADRFDDIIDNQLQVVVFREPLERMRSQYDHWRRTKGKEIWRVHTPYEEGMPFEDYALLPQLQNYQSQALAGKDLNEFAIVGVTEDLQSYTAALVELIDREGLAHTGAKQVSLPHINKTPIARRSDLSVVNTVFQNTFRKTHAVDYELYNHALERNT